MSLTNTASAALSATVAENAAAEAKSYAQTAGMAEDFSNQAQASAEAAAAAESSSIDAATSAAASETSSAEAAAVAALAAQNATITANIYPTLADAQAAITAGTIPPNALFNVAVPAGSTPPRFADQYQNVAGVATPTGVSYPSQESLNNAVNKISAQIQQEIAHENILSVTDPNNFIIASIAGSGALNTPMLNFNANGMTSGSMGVVNDDYLPDGVFESDGVGFSVPVNSGGGGGGEDPGEVTVNLPPQTAAYNLLSKMRSALDDVCIVINSDSTGVTSATDSDGTTFYKWTYNLAKFLASNYPAYTVNYYTWSTSTGNYNSPVTLQVGTAGKTLHFYNAAVAGTQPQYLMGQYFETAYVPRQADLLIINHGHNTDTNVPPAVHAGMILAVAYQMLARQPTAGMIMFSQNPLRDGDQGANRSTGARQAAVSAGFSLVDVYELFMNAGKPPGWYVDNIHPNSTGDGKIFEMLKDFFVWPANPAFYFPGLINGADILPNADFSMWSDSNPSPDGWILTGCTAEKDLTNFDSGGWGMKLVSTGTAEAYAAYSLSAGVVRKLRGKTVFLACLVYVPTTSTRAYCGHMAIPEASSNRPYGVTTPNGRGGFLWKGTIATIPLNATTLTVRAGLDVAGGVADNWCTFDRLPLIVGNIPQDFY